MLMILYPVSCDIYAQPTKSLIVLETDQPVSIPTPCEQSWQGHDSCSGLTQLVRSCESLACLQLRNGSPEG